MVTLIKKLELKKGNFLLENKYYTYLMKYRFKYHCESHMPLNINRDLLNLVYSPSNTKFFLQKFIK